MRQVFKSNKAPARPRKSLKEWLDLVLPLATLLLGVVSVWTTIQISGLEDYFRSEIARRNSEISSLAIRSTDAERKIADRERRVGELSSVAERLGAQNDEQRLILSRATLEVDSLRSEAGLNKQRLGEALEERRRVEADLVVQQTTLETLARREVYQLVSSRAFFIRLTSLVGGGRNSAGRREVGAEFYQALQTVRVGEPRLDQYLGQLKLNFARVCPAFPNLVVEFPSPPGDPNYDAPPFRSIRTSRDREEFMALYNLEIARERAEWEQRNTAYRAELDAKWDSVQNQFDACACSALTTSAVARTSICPVET